MDSVQQLSTAGTSVTPLTSGWRLALTAANACATPDAAQTVAPLLPAPVPGTVAQALEEAGLFDRTAPSPLQDRDAWYFLDLDDQPAGEAILRFEGLATLAEIFLDGERLLVSQSMFERHDLPVILGGNHRLAICFRALTPHLDRSGPRARWRPRMFDHQGLRLVRTALLGHMPGWCPSIQAVGPYRPISVLRRGKVSFRNVKAQATLIEETLGRLEISFDLDGASTASVVCNGQRVDASADDDGRWHARMDVADIEPWWPHTHGRPALYDVEIEAGGVCLSLLKTGFRSLRLDTGADGKGFGVEINGVPVFCRGAVWTTTDIVRLSGTTDDYLPLLEKAVEAGMNMIRIGGTMLYESPDFLACCDRLGIMVWQDLMLANFDYPFRDEAFSTRLRREIADQLGPITGSPSLTVVCGGSEVQQQAAMLGLPRLIWEGAGNGAMLSSEVSLHRPDVITAPNSPFGGPMPFAPGEGVTHYYGVGAYERPLEDARRAHVRFSAESLAFSQVPEQRLLDHHLPVPALHDPRWKARVPRDASASWDFEDTRDHYLGALYGVVPAQLRRQDMARYLDLSRAVTGEVSEAVFSEWRRPGSSCRGGLVWTFKDLLPGAGWGILDATGEAKPVYHALKRAFRPVQVLLTDEGTNGLDVHVLNERREPLSVTLELTCLRDGRVPVVGSKRELVLLPGEGQSFAATDLFGAFFDTTYAFRFGPPSHDVSVARLRDASGTLLADAFHFPLGRSAALHPAAIEASLVRDAEGWVLILQADRFAQSVHIGSETHEAVENWFHLAPGIERRIRLKCRDGVDATLLPTGDIRSLGTSETATF